MLFKILKIRKMVREGTENPSGFAGEQAGELLWGFLAIPIIIAVAVLILLSIFSFTHVWGGPFLLAKIFFWIILCGTCLFIYIVRKGISAVKKMTTKATDETIKVTSQIVE